MDKYGHMVGVFTGAETSCNKVHEVLKKLYNGKGDFPEILEQKVQVFYEDEQPLNKQVLHIQYEKNSKESVIQYWQVMRMVSIMILVFDLENEASLTEVVKLWNELKPQMSKTVREVLLIGVHDGNQAQESHVQHATKVAIDNNMFFMLFTSKEQADPSVLRAKLAEVAAKVLHCI